jgi:DNA-directed RNA polymerase specialized sigma24 family protein
VKAADAEVARGYTMRDLHKLAAAAYSYDRSMASDAATRYDIAWSAIAEALCASEEPPTWHDLFTIGWRAIYAEVREMRHLFGQRDKDGTNEVASSPRFRQYWTLPHERPEEGIAERAAVPQILAVLRPTEREAVIALAVHDDYQRAAEALGINYSTLTQRMTAARRRFRTHWYAPETAPPIKGTDRRVGSHDKPLATHCKGGKGPHEMTPENTYRRPSPKAGRRGERVCRACETERGQARWERKKAAREAA